MCIFQKNIFESVFPHHSTVYSMWPTLRKEKKPINLENLFVSHFLIGNWNNKKKDNAQWLKSIFVFHCTGAIYHCVHFATTSFLQVPSVFTLSKVKATFTNLTPVFPLLFHGSLLSVTSDHSYFLILLDSVSYLTSIITVIKNQKLFLMKILSLLYL